MNRKVGRQKRFNFLSFVFGWEDRKVGGQKTHLFGGKGIWYKFTIISLLNKTKVAHFFLFKNCVWTQFFFYFKREQHNLKKKKRKKKKEREQAKGR